MKKVLLDTNAYAHYMAGNDVVLERMGESDVIYLSVFVLAELQYGFKHGRKTDENMRDLKVFLQKPTVQTIHTSAETADIYAEIESRLRKNGTPIPNNDIWIAAHAIETGSVLITNDGHFDHIAGLRKTGL